MSFSSEEIVHFIINVIWNQKRLDRLHEAFDAHTNFHGSVETAQGCDAIKAILQKWVDAFPDLHYTADDIVISGNKVACRWHGSGTHQGRFLGIDPTGKAIKHVGIEMIHLEKGKVREFWASSNMLEIYKHLTTP